MPLACRLLEHPAGSVGHPRDIPLRSDVMHREAHLVRDRVSVRVRIRVRVRVRVRARVGVWVG